MGVVSALVESVPDNTVISLPEIQPVVLLIAFFIGMIVAAIFVREAEKSEIWKN
jgi:hypothetical protein